MPSQFRQYSFTSETWFFAIAAISLTPVVQGFITTTLSGGITYSQLLVRVLSIVTILTDIFLVNLAVKIFKKSNIFELKEIKIISILFVLLTVIMLSAIFSQSSNVFFSVFISFRYLLQIAALISIYFIIFSSQIFDAERYFGVMVTGSILYVIYIALVALMIPDPFTFPWIGGLPSATSVRHIGNYVAIFSIAAIATSLFAAGRYRALSLAVVFVLIMFLAWTGSRAAFFGIGFALVISLFVLRHHIRAGRVGALAITLILALLAAIPLPVPSDSFGVLRMINASDTRQTGDISSARIEVWQNTAREIAQAPVIGHGAGRFIGNMSEKYGYDLDNPHNFILQFAYDWGLVGLTVALALLWIAGLHLYRLPVISPMASFCAVSGFTLMLTIGMLEGMFYHPLKMLLVSALVAPSFALAQREAEWR